jgi:RHS repeat-associated protein
VRGIYQTENNTESFVYSFIYNGEGDLYELRNYRTHRASFFEYDHAGRCMASRERAFTVTNGRITYGANLSSYGYQYNECNNLSKLTCSVLGSTWSTVYTYDRDNRPSTTTLSTGKVISNTYDAFGRLNKRTIGLSTPYETRFEYHLNGSNRTPLLHKYYNGSDDPFVYNYDDNGNIISITQGSTSITYKYDVANRLTRENNSILNQTITYEYDYYGNITEKKIYAYTTATNPGTPTDTIGYTYNSTGWTDQLKKYGNDTISYDSMGNPTTYRGYTMTWRGKQLTSASNGTVSATFEYNEDGLRQKKTVNNVDTDYFYNGSVLIGMQRGTDKLLFSYDASGSVVSVNYNGTEYYYLRNAQGDIVKLIDASGNTVVKYIYDTWGKKVTTTGALAGTLGLIQPFRYRGYVYDWETGLYYLQSRYYDPTTGRFISADVLLSTGQGVMGHNAYAYCLDNPVSIAGLDTKWTQFIFFHWTYWTI